MAKYDPPPKFSFKAEEWEDWFAEYEEFRHAAKVDLEEGSAQVSSLFYSMGARNAKQIFKTFKFGKVTVINADGQNEEVDENPNDFATVARKFTEHFVPKKNVIHQRSMFHERSQKDLETVEEYVRALQVLVQSCGYRDAEEQVRDRFVIGMKDTQVKQKLQLIPDLTLDRAVLIARQHEQVKEQVRQQSAEVHEAVQVKGKGRGFRRNFRGCGRGQSHQIPAKRDSNHNMQDRCARCGKNHPSQRCPASGATCHFCRN